MRQDLPKTAQGFNPGWPQDDKDENGVPLEFDVLLARKVEIPDGTIIRAFVDDSEQYKADGRCWRAITSCDTVEPGQRLEKEAVVGWIPISTE